MIVLSKNKKSKTGHKSGKELNDDAIQSLYNLLYASRRLCLVKKKRENNMRKRAR